MSEIIISIVITNYNRKDMLGRCISLLEENTKVKHELIVVDDASSDGSAEMVRKKFPKAKLIANKENLGFAKSNNLGISASKGEFVILLNNDIEVGKNWEWGFLDAAKDDETGIVGCKLLYPNGRIQHAGCSLTPWKIVFHGRGDADKGQYDKVREYDYVTGAAFFIKRAVIEKIGYLDEGYSPLYYEETDYCMRAKKAGFRVVYTPKSVLIHKEGATVTGMGRVFYYRERSRVRFMLKNYSPLWLVLAFPAEVFRLVKSVFKGRTSPFLKAYGYNFNRLWEIFKKRKEIYCDKGAMSR